MTLEVLPAVYIPGSLQVSRDSDSRFTLQGNYMVGATHNADHMQLIYEALEIAANSDDKFAPTFAAFRDELLKLTEHWDE